MMTLVFTPTGEESELLGEIHAELRATDELPVRVDFGGGLSVDAPGLAELREGQVRAVEEAVAKLASYLGHLDEYLAGLKDREPETSAGVDTASAANQEMISFAERKQASEMERGWPDLQGSLAGIPVGEAEERERRDQMVEVVDLTIKGVVEQIRKPDPDEMMWEVLPSFLFVDAELANLLPGEADLRKLADGGESEQRFDVVRRLLALGGVDVKAYLSFEPQRRARVLSRAGERITKSLQGVWSQEKVRIQLIGEGDVLRIYVETPGGDYGFPLRRSRGFQWFLAFYLTYAFAASEGLQNTVLLLDEPGIHLHPMGQRDLLARLREIGLSSQVIYTTHLADMIDLENPERVRVVTKEPGPGTTIINEAWQPREEAVAFEVVMNALWGAVFSPSLTLGRANLILEGASDHVYVLAVGKVLAKEEPKYASLVNGEVYLLSTRGVSHFRALVRFCMRKGLRNVALFDSDQTGRRTKKELIDEGALTEQEAVEINDILDDKKTERDVEAVVGLPLVKEAVLAAYGDELPVGFSFGDKDLPKRGGLGTRIRDFMKDTMGVGEFNKLVVAFKVKEILERDPSRLPERARRYFRELFDVILDRLDRT